MTLCAKHSIQHLADNKYSSRLALYMLTLLLLYSLRNKLPPHAILISTRTDAGQHAGLLELRSWHYVTSLRHW
jgi:hypothetical protein